MDVMEAIESAAKEYLPKTGGIKKSLGGDIVLVAGWSEHVKPFAEESKFWCNVGHSLGKPSKGDVFNIMKASKNQY